MTALAAARHLRSERGQVFPVLVVLMASVLVLGLTLFHAGDATGIRAEAQSAADAAALAGAKGLREELAGQPASAPISEALARAGAASYARRNNARVIDFDRRGLDVFVTVESRDALVQDAERAGSAGATMKARARARLEPNLMVGGTSLLAPAGGGDAPSGGGSCASPQEAEKALSGDVNGIVGLGRTLQRLGISVSEHPAFGGVDPVHAPNSYHYRAGAIDVNAEACGESATFDRIAPLIEKAGFGVLWRVEGHHDHLHADEGGGGGVGVGGGAGGGPLHTLYEIRLVDYEE